MSLFRKFRHFHILIAIVLAVCGVAVGQEVADQDVPPDFDYASLAHPEISEFLQLDDSQRSQIAALATEQATKLAAAAEADRAAITAEYAGKLKAVLTPEQQGKISQIPELRKLQFNFGSQNWEDVLRWFAKQADLSLVMSSAPPGAFNYADTNRYTPAQAINLLNSILLTKGFTLVRRDKLLILVELAGGIPDELLPRVTLDEMDERGSFEIVSVMFSLRDKPAETVMAEVKPILGSYGKMALLPQSNQLLVTETVGKIRAINMLIESVPSPKPPAKPTPPADAPPPVLQSYALGALDFEATSAAIKSIAPALVISGGPATQKIVAYGPPAQQELLKTLLEQLSSGTPASEQASHLKVYQLEKPVEPKLITEQIALVAPQAKVAVNEAGLRILVYASAAQHLQVAQVLEQLDVVAVVDEGSQVRLFSLRRADPAVAAQMAQAVSPRAKVTVDTPTKTLVVRAIPAELEIIAQLIDQLDGSQLARQSATLHTYDVLPAQKTQFLALQQSLPAEFGQVQVLADEVPTKLTVWADATQHAMVASMLEQLKSQVADQSAFVLKSYEALVADLPGLQALLQPQFPDAKISANATGDRLLVWAAPDQQEAIAARLAQLSAELPQRDLPYYESFAVAEADQTAAITALQPLAPNAKITADAGQKRLLVWGTAKEQETLRTAIEKLFGGEGGQPTNLTTVPLEGLDATTTTTLLKTLVPRASITLDAATQQLVIVGSAADQAAAQKVLAQLQEGLKLHGEPTIKFYPLEPSQAAAATDLLATLVPKAKAKYDATTEQMSVVATAKEHAKVTQALTDFQAGARPPVRPELVVYPIAADLRPRLNAVLASLAAELGEVKIVDEQRPGEVAILASTTQHALIQSIIQDVSRPVEGVEPFMLAAYPAGSTDPQQIVQFLTQLFPTSKVVADDNGLRVLVWAQPAAHQEIEKVLKQFVPDQDPPGQNPQSLRSYKLSNIQATAAIPLLQQLVPRMQLVGADEQDVILAWGRERDHQQLKLAVEQLSLPDDPKRLSVRVYPTNEVDPQIAALVIGRILPEAIAVPDVNGRIVAVLARADQHGLVAEALTQMAQFNTASGPLAATVYRVERTGSTAVVAALAPIFPQAKLFAGAATSQVVVLANAEDHQKIKATIEQLERESASQGLSLRVYQLRADLAAQVRPLIAAALPTLKILGSDVASLVIFAKTEEHAVVQQLVEQAEQQLVAVPQSIQAYALKELTAAQAKAGLAQKIPTLSYVELGGDPRVLYILGSTEEHAAIALTLQELEATIVQQPVPLVATYPSGGVDLTQLVSLLPADLAGQASIKTDPVNELLIVSAPDEVQAKLQVAIAELQTKLPKLERPVARIYPLGGMQPKDWTTLLGTIAPGSVVATDASSRSLVVTATRQTHETIAQLIEDIRRATTQGKVARPYRVSKADVTAVSTALTTLLPEASITADQASRSLIVIASEEDQQTVEQTLQQIDLHAPNAVLSQVYAIASGDATPLATALKSLIPSATYVPDPSGRALLVLASSDEQAQIKQTIDQWTGDPARALTTKVYPLKKADPTTSLPVLQKLMPAVTFSADPASRSIAAAATAEQHLAIAQALGELDSVTGSIETKIYPLGGLTARDWQALLTQLAPGTIAAADPNSNSLIVAAGSEAHQRIAELMEEFKTVVTEGKVARAYRVSKADVTVASQAVSALLPNSQVSVDKIARSIVVVATEEEQVTAAATIEQIDMNAPGAAVSQVYSVNTGDATELATALRSLVPGASFVADKQGKSLLVLATAEEQEQIRATVTQWTSDPSRVLATKVYPLRQADPTAALPVLQKLLPSATFSADPATGAIAATATADQHQNIAAAVKELDAVTEPAETRVYSAGGLTARDWQALLTQLAPGVVSAVDPDSGSLIVLARSQTHQQIGQLVEQFRNSVTAGKSIRAYRLTQADAQIAADSISALVPLSKVSVDKASRTIIVVASEVDQEMIATVIQQIDRETTGAAVSQIYPVPTGDALALATALKSLVPTGTYVADATGKSLLVIASPADQAVLGKTVADWGGDARRTVTSQVYHLEHADPTTALAALQKLIPGATLAADAATRSLLATGTADQHALLRQTVEQLDGGAGASGETTLATYLVRRVPADSLAKALSDLFKKDPQVSVVADKETNALIAIARSKQHAMIRTMLESADREVAGADGGSQVQIYPLANSDGEALVTTLEKLFERERPAPQVSYDEQAQQLFVLGNPTQQALVQQLVGRMTGEQQDFEMFRLRAVDPFTAESAINGLFRQEPRATAPTVQVDFDNSYLFVRASPAQMERIKEVLKKLGEPELNGASAGDQRMRVVPLGADTERVIEQLQRLWPQLQSNELRVLQTPDEVPTQEPVPNSQPQRLPDSNSLPPLESEGTHPVAVMRAPRRAAGPPALPQDNAANSLPSAQPPAANRLQDKPPVFIIPGIRQLTIASADPVAVQQLEELILMISGPLAESNTSGNFETFPLKNAGASEVAAILTDLYEGMGENKRTTGPPVVIAADDRLNFLIVHGSRADRETLGKLAAVLDSPDVNDAFSINQPVIVPVKNTDAERILAILNSVYRSQLSSGGGRRQLPIPKGVSTELASMLQQINVATSGPLLTLGVDAITNSLIVLAPQQLRDQVRATIEQLDQNVETEPGEKIEIIQLQQTNPVRIQRALDLLFNENKK